MATTLNLPQPPTAHLYPHAVSIYRVEPDMAVDGQPSGDGLTWSLLAAGVACYFESKQPLTVPAEFLMLEGGPQDLFHFAAEVDVRSSDVLLLTTFPQAALVGLYWRVRGNPADHHFAAGKRVVAADATPKPSGIT